MSKNWSILLLGTLLVVQANAEIYLPRPPLILAEYVHTARNEILSKSTRCIKKVFKEVVKEVNNETDVIEATGREELLELVNRTIELIADVEKPWKNGDDSLKLLKELSVINADARELAAVYSSDRPGWLTTLANGFQECKKLITDIMLRFMGGFERELNRFIEGSNPEEKTKHAKLLAWYPNFKSKEKELNEERKIYTFVEVFNFFPS